ncbi:MAG TPA: tyrosine--tRNA ligase [Candidatus Saccharimonadales bacterium]|nr:tyrosine--tRNA ligase [Candidatus Saccharimonadales bacterium]
MSEMTLLEELQWRGLLKDHTFEDLSWLNKPHSFYLGSDGSADSLTIGNLAIYMMARVLAKHGWKAVLLVGGATSLIGDPGGKDEERPLKTKEEIEHNIAGIAGQVERMFDGLPFEMVNNYDWFKDIGYLDFLRDVGKHFSMTELMQREFITARMNEGGAGISYAEFSYNLIQGYDFYWLFKHKGVEAQIGASDQWGNMLSGAALIRKLDGQEAHAFTMPLVVNKTTGKKFGKSEAGAVWLDPKRTSPTQFYQFWMNASDDEVEDFLKIYTALSKPEVDELMREFNVNRAGRAAQKRLAYEVTALMHGKERAEEEQMAYEADLRKVDVRDLSDKQVERLKQVLPYTTVALTDSLVEIMVSLSFASSKSEALRLIASGGVYINREKAMLTDDGYADIVRFRDGLNVLQVGKSRFALVEQR